MSEDIVCNLCGNSYSSISALNRHKKYSLKCSGTKSFPCEYCSSGFTTADSKRIHEDKCPAKKVVEDFQEQIRILTERNTKLTNKLEKKDESIESLEQTLEEKDEKIVSLLSKNKKLKENVTEIRDEMNRLKGEVKRGAEDFKLVARQPKTTIKKANITVNQKINNAVPCSTIHPFTREVLDNLLRNEKQMKNFLTRCDAGNSDKAIPDLIISTMRKKDEKNYICTNDTKGKYYFLPDNRKWKTDNMNSQVKEFIDIIAEAFNDFYFNLKEEYENWKEKKPFNEEKEKKYLHCLNERNQVAAELENPESKLWKTIFKRTRDKIKSELKVDLE